MKRERNLLRRIFPFFKGRRRVGNAALDSTAWNMKTADYYADAIDQSANQLFDQSTREIAQNRGMHEYLNDPLFFGACQKIASLVCGSNVALKIEGPIKTFGAGDVPDQGAKSQYLEKAFKRFADAIDLLSLIRLLQSSLLYSGEAFIRKVKHETTIEGYSYVFIRPQRVQNPPGLGTDELVNDGILYNSTDDGAEPVAYYVQREKINPLTELGIEYDLVPAGEIIHVFNAILPQQRRGIPEVQTALNIIREIKLLRGLEIQAVKNAAKTSVILTTDAEPIIDAAYSGEEIAVPAPGATGAELPDGVFIARPGYTPTFGESKHPATGFNEFKKTLAADVGAALGVGSGKINNNHADYNFSSAKMDEQHDAVIVAVRQKKIANSFLNVVFNDWLTEFATRDEVAEEFLDVAGAPEQIARRWLFPSPRSIDRLKDAQADSIELENNTITLEEIAARRGLDLEELLIERAREAKILEDAGLKTKEKEEKKEGSIPTVEDDVNGFAED